jgi:two-component system LytT family sensor kinase
MSINYEVKNTWRKENGKYLAGILIVFGLSVGLLIASLVISGDPLTDLFAKDILIVNSQLLLIPVLTVNVIYLFKRFFYRHCNTRIKLLFLKTLGLITGVFIGTAIVEVFSFLVGFVDDDYLYFGGYKMSAIATNFATNEALGLLIGVPTFLREAKRARVQHALNLKELELNAAHELTTQSELETLQAKINPHFLYNSLNSIVSLIHENPDKAEKMVLSLSDLFRYSINSKEGNYSTIEEELSMVTTYLEIEHVRFQDQLHFEIVADKAINQLKIPKFLIQPLIENAIKHGTSKIKQGTVKLVVALQDQDLHISVFDNGPAFPEALNSGYGLKSTIDKLEILYKNSYDLQLVNEPEKQLKIKLKKIQLHESNQ